MYSKKDVAVMVRDLRIVHPWRPSVEIVLHWFALLAVIYLAVHVNIWWVYGLCMLAIGALQYALLILLHDAQHSLLHPDKRINNWLATWLIAAPCITEFERSQKRHLAHHQLFGDASQDPDYPLYATGEPHAKKSLAQLAKHFFHRMAGIKLAGAVSQGKEHHHWLPVIVMQIVLFAAFAATIGWAFYFLLWLIPLAAGAVLLNDLRIFCEHSNAGKDSTAPDDIMISYVSNPLERFFFAPNHMNYHAEHHLFPHVPHSQLPKLRALIRQTPELESAIQWRSSYTSYLCHYIGSIRT